MQIGGWKTHGVFDRYNIIDRRNMATYASSKRMRRRWESPGSGYNSGYRAPDSVQNTPPEKIQ